jgi:hypothetical protein
MRTLNILKKKTPRAEMAADSAIRHATPLSPSEPIAEIVDAVDLLLKIMRKREREVDGCCFYCFATVSGQIQDS